LVLVGSEGEGDSPCLDNDRIDDYLSGLSMSSEQERPVRAESQTPAHIPVERVEEVQDFNPVVRNY
jgi:hypothetical protein